MYLKALRRGEIEGNLEIQEGIEGKGQDK